MPRRPRYDLPDGPVHVTSRGNRRAPIYLDRLDYNWFLADVETSVTRFSWTCLAFAMLPNHFHLLVDAPRGALSEGMHWLNGRHARRFNRRHGYKGHLFEERFGGTAIEGDGHFVQVLQYIALNSWRAGLCTHPAACPRTSHRVVAGLARPLPFLATEQVLSLFGVDAQRARQRYVEFVERGMAA